MKAAKTMRIRRQVDPQLADEPECMAPRRGDPLGCCRPTGLTDVTELIDEAVIEISRVAVAGE